MLNASWLFFMLNFSVLVETGTLNDLTVSQIVVISNQLHGESKVLQYFGNMRHNSAASNAIAEVEKVTNYTGLGDAKLT